MRAKARVSHSATSKLGPRFPSVGTAGNIAGPLVSLRDERVDIRSCLIEQATAVRSVDLNWI